MWGPETTTTVDPTNIGTGREEEGEGGWERRGRRVGKKGKEGGKA